MPPQSSLDLSGCWTVVLFRSRTVCQVKGHFPSKNHRTAMQESKAGRAALPAVDQICQNSTGLNLFKTGARPSPWPVQDVQGRCTPSKGCLYCFSGRGKTVMTCGIFVPEIGTDSRDAENQGCMARVDALTIGQPCVELVDQRASRRFMDD